MGMTDINNAAAAQNALTARMNGFLDGIDGDVAAALAPVAAKIAEMDAEIASFYLKHTPLNLLPDFGRFLADPTITSINGETSTFQAPDYMIGYNGTTVADAGHFIEQNDNNAIGAPIGGRTMTDAVASLTSEYFGAGWHIAEFTQGAGAAVPTTVDGVTYYQTLHQTQTVIGHSPVTVRCWFRCTAGGLLLPSNGEMHIDGEDAGATVIGDNDWHNLSYIYSSSADQGRANWIWPFRCTPGAKLQIAMPSISAGRVMFEHPFNKQFHVGDGIYG